MKVGMDAIKAANFPHEFSADAMLKSYDLRTSIAIRAGQPPNTNKGFSVAFKPMALKTKTSSDAQGVPIVAGFIPVDQATFGRSHSKPIPDTEEFKNPVQLRVTLQEILHDVERGKYTCIRNGDYLEFATTQPDNTHYDSSDGNKIDKRLIHFRVDLTKGVDAELKGQSGALIRPWDETPLKKWDSEKFGNLGDHQNKLFEVSYQLPDQKNYNPLMVTAIGGKPVTGDADLLSVAAPLEFSQGNCGVKYNTSKTSDRQHLVEDYLVIHRRLSNEAIDVEKIPSLVKETREFAKTAGIITPFQLLMAKVVNDEFAKAVPYFKDLFQHGPETNNPGEPSDLNGNMLHFYKGLAVLTQTEDELVDFILQKGYLEEHFYPVHHGWNMEKWGHVIERQIELGQKNLIDPKTISTYEEYKQLHPELPQRMSTEVQGYLFSTRRVTEVPSPSGALWERVARSVG